MVIGIVWRALLKPKGHVSEKSTEMTTDSYAKG